MFEACYHFIIFNSTDLNPILLAFHIALHQASSCISFYQVPYLKESTVYPLLCFAILEYLNYVSSNWSLCRLDTPVESLKNMSSWRGKKGFNFLMWAFFCQNERATLEQKKAEDEVLLLAGEQQVCIIFIISYGLSLPPSWLWLCIFIYFVLILFPK